MKREYHSALGHGINQNAPLVSRAERHGCTFLAHDIALGLPPEMASCDVLYAEPPWRHGYDIFNQRAGVEALLPWRTFMYRIGDLLAAAPCPAVLIAGPDGAKYLPAPASRQPITLNGGDALVLGWRLELPEFGAKAFTTNVIAHLAERYQRVGDFCCGYGVTGRIFLEHGKTCVLSDHNATCIGYIVSQIDSWVRP